MQKTSVEDRHHGKVSPFLDEQKLKMKADRRLKQKQAAQNKYRNIASIYRNEVERPRFLWVGTCRTHVGQK